MSGISSSIYPCVASWQNNPLLLSSGKLHVYLFNKLTLSGKVLSYQNDPDLSFHNAN
jgi:hypothetical protein